MKNLIIPLIYPSILGTVLTLFSFYASAHSYIRMPESRAYLCSFNDYLKEPKTPLNNDCGLGPEYEPQSIETQKGFPESGPPDGLIASGGGIERFSPLDVQTPTRWHKIDIVHSPLIKTLQIRDF
ncbi:lytic polysaccharide monooxygenase [Providencia stuartii]|uniref:lytic polysaccharide monooxygenase n=1 Tax=Providencia stuartii TaxID=588 RepID=UPI00331AF3A4